ncbi:hypothetical protein ACX27_23680 [Nostoc piscinale CENA21]|uniref:Uncharacterized protein n=1 Tax=Nostoc piscinale CENA21 TaxID=224013 RepID=A0A0M3V669_9NOSO|nr:hypothetical protein [Nostoc piscinale]ALF55143.1 hypothetical protein ACX27_23680 [Nostoc piscinale CENA21]
MADKQLIKQLADEFGWTQADVKRAIEASQDNVTTRDEAILCMIRYAGSDLKKRNYELAAQKRVNVSQKEMIQGLIEQLTNIQDFYAAKLVPTLRATIIEQAAYIADLLNQVSGKNQGGSNGQ